MRLWRRKKLNKPTIHFGVKVQLIKTTTILGVSERRSLAEVETKFWVKIVDIYNIDPNCDRQLIPAASQANAQEIYDQIVNDLGQSCTSKILTEITIPQ